MLLHRPFHVSFQNIDLFLARIGCKLSTTPDSGVVGIFVAAELSGQVKHNLAFCGCHLLEQDVQIEVWLSNSLAVQDQF